MDLFHVNRGFTFPYHSLLAWDGKPYVIDRGLCALTSKVTLLVAVILKQVWGNT